MDYIASPDVCRAAWTSTRGARGPLDVESRSRIRGAAAVRPLCFLQLVNCRNFGTGEIEMFERMSVRVGAAYIGAWAVIALIAQVLT